MTARVIMPTIIDWMALTGMLIIAWMVRSLLTGMMHAFLTCPLLDVPNHMLCLSPVNAFFTLCLNLLPGLLSGLSHRPAENLDKTDNDKNNADSKKQPHVNLPGQKISVPAEPADHQSDNNVSQPRN